MGSIVAMRKWRPFRRELSEGGVAGASVELGPGCGRLYVF